MTRPSVNALQEAPSSGKWARHLFAAALLLCACVALVPLWSVKYPPMVDLPQHAAQVFVWSHFDDPAFDFPGVYSLNYRTPYLLGYALTRVFAVFLPMHAALKMVVSATVLGLPLALWHLLSVTGGDRWWALLGFPLAYGFAFYWGFLNFLVAVPVAVLFVAAGLRAVGEPSWRRGWVLGALALAVFMSHALAFAVTVPAVGLVALTGCVSPPGSPEGDGGGLRRAVRLIVPLALPALLVPLWVLLAGRYDAAVGVAQGNVWAESPWERLVDLPLLLVGAPQSKGLWWLGGLGVLLAVLTFGVVHRRPVHLWMPVLVAAAIFFLAPNRALGTWFVYPRLAVFLPLFALVPLGVASASWRRRGARAALVALVLGWSLFLIPGFRAVDRDARGFDQLLEEMAPGRRVLGLIFEPGLRHQLGLPVFGHFHLWYQGTKGGRVEYSFAMSFQSLVRYREGVSPLAQPGLAHQPDRFDWQRDGRFDYFVVRSDTALGPVLFADATAPVTLVRRAGSWWLYHRLPARPRSP